ncbi:MAG: glycosyltransferase [Planctomycetota bacterium]
MITFVVPAHNEEQLLPATLESIHEACTHVGEPYEVVVADDASTDSTARIAKAFGARVVSVEHRQIAATRNSGAAASQADWLIFVDADTLITPDVLQATVDALEGGAVGGGARVDFEGDAPPLVRLLAGIFEPFYFWLRLAAGCYVFCTREAFEQAGGFDEQLYASEEITLSNELKKLGPFVVLPQRVITSGRKLRTHTVGEMLRPAVAMMLQGRKTFDKRDGLDLWYGPRRDDSPAKRQ